MRRDGEPITDFTLPEKCPAAVHDAYVAYRGLAEQYSEARAQLAIAENAIENARREDVRELSAAFEAGRSDATLESRHEIASREAADAQRVKVDALEEAVDRSGDRMLDALEEAQPQWLADCETLISDAEESYLAAISQAKAAARALVETRGFREWLRRLEVRRVRTGGGMAGTHLLMRWNGVQDYQLHVPAPGSHDSIGMDTIPAFELLASLERAVTGARPVDDLARVTL
jgi:hypothetical protein